MTGSPGTAKSSLFRAIAQAFGGIYFERLVTRFSTPEELFGAISLKALEQDRFARVVTGKLPEAEFAFIDEIWKSSSAILNSLLTLVNERVFHNDGQPISCPLVTIFAASNELPDGKDLEALFDRFLLRFEVMYVLRPGNLKLILAAPDPVASQIMTMADLRNAQAEVAKVAVTDETIDALIQVRDACKAEGIVASDRRWKKSIKLSQATAYMAGEKKTSPEDLSILVDSLWREPKERPKVARLVGKLADPVGAQASEILDAARETATKVAALTAGDRKAYIAEDSRSKPSLRYLGEPPPPSGGGRPPALAARGAAPARRALAALAPLAGAVGRLLAAASLLSHLALSRRRNVHAGAAGFGEPDGDGLLRVLHPVLAFLDVLHLLADELAGLRRRRLAALLVAPRALDRALLGHERNVFLDWAAAREVNPGRHRRREGHRASR